MMACAHARSYRLPFEWQNAALYGYPTHKTRTDAGCEGQATFCNSAETTAVGSAKTLRRWPRHGQALQSTMYAGTQTRATLDEGGSSVTESQSAQHELHVTPD